MKKCAITLPGFELLKKQPKIPHVAHVIAQRKIPNEHGALIEFTVRQSRNGKEWWIGAVESGSVCIKD